MSLLFFASGAEIGFHFHWVTMLPFIGILLAVMIMTGVFPHQWEDFRWYGGISLVIAVVSVIGIMTYGAWHLLKHAMFEYSQFMPLIFALYSIVSSIAISGDWRAIPEVNALILFVGALLASAFGTTGAAIFLLPFLIQTNHRRIYLRHTLIFFIFLVCNIGGSLTPVGDPPLFMAYIKGVPFEWPLYNLSGSWLFMVLFLLSIYYVWDVYLYTYKEPSENIQLDIQEVKPLEKTGFINFITIGLLLLTLVYVRVSPYREIIMLLLGFIGLRVKGAKKARKINNFTWNPVLEVACVFLAIFLSMGFVTTYVNYRVDLLVKQGYEFQPWQFAVVPGALSSFLDNAPTFLIFFEAGKAIGTSDMNLVAGISPDLLRSLSIGTVFLGAGSYLGNVPNMLGRNMANARRKGVMPSFVGYLKWSVGILIPAFVLVVLYFCQPDPDLQLLSISIVSIFVFIALWVFIHRATYWLPVLINNVRHWFSTWKGYGRYLWNIFNEWRIKNFVKK